jgi:phage FluMu protein Com
MWLRILLLSWCNKILLIFACDLYIASKCPQLPATNEFNINSETYCKHIKDHIDCINSKLKLCKRVQEYGPALETIKANLKVFILQVRFIILKNYII